jgi:hypothetical protein
MPALTKTLRGLAVLDPRWTVDALDASSVYDEADAQPGETTGDGELAPRILGGQSATIEVLPIVAGVPGTVGYRLPGETEQALRGMEGPVCTGSCPPDTLASSTWVGAVVHAPSQRVVATWARAGVASTAAGAWWDPTTYTWTPFATLPTFPVGSWGGINSPLVPYIRADDIILVGPVASIRSSDWGATWVRHGSDYTGAAAASVQTRGAIDGQGRWLLTGDSGADCELQASSDYGATWTDVATIDDAQHHGVAAMPDGRIVFVYTDAADTYTPKAYILATAYDDPTSRTPVEITSTTGLDTDRIAVAVEPDGTIRVTIADLFALRIYTSTDGGASYSGPIAIPIANEMRCPVQVHAAGRHMLLHQRQPPGIGNGVSIGGVGAILLGGWSGAMFGELPGDASWVGTDEPDAEWTAWGTPGDTMVAGGMRLYSAAAAGGYEVDPGVEVQQFAEFETVEVINSATLEGGFRMRIDTGTVEQSVTVFMEPDGFRIRDSVATAWLSSKFAIDLTIPMCWRAEQTGTNFRLAYRRPWKTEWTWSTAASSGYWFPTTTASTGSSFIRFGNFSSTAAVEIIWRFAKWGGIGPTVLAPGYQFGLRAFGPSVIRGIDGAPLPPRGGWPIPEASTSTTAALLTAQGGPGLESEVYTIRPAHGYPVDALFPASPSPSQEYRSGALSDYTADWQIAVDLGADSRIAGCATVALVIRGGTVRQWALRGQIDGGSPTTLGTLDLATGFAGVDYALDGDTLAPPASYSGTEGGRYLAAGELVGGYVVLDTGGTPSVHRIAEQSAGWWGSSPGPRAVLRLEGLVGTEAATGTCDLLAPQGVMVVDLEADEFYRTWVVRVDRTQPAFEDRVAAGRLWVMGLRAFGKQYDRGYVWRVDPRVAVDEDATGTQRRRRQGPLRRSATIDWAHGVQLRTVRTGGAAPGYLANGEGVALVARDAVYDTLIGVMQTSDDGAAPVLLLATVPTSGETLTDPTRFLVGYLDSPIGARQVTGTEGQDEYLRLDSMTIIEAV